MLFVECMDGFPVDLQGLTNGKHLLSGSYLFPNITIQCHGRVTAIFFYGFFNSGVRYSSRITLQVVFYSLSEFQYKPKAAYTMNCKLGTLAPKLPSLMKDDSGRYYVLKPLVVSMSSKLDKPLEVSPGYILGISLPPTQSLRDAVVSHGVSIPVLDDTDTETFNNSYWNVVSSPRASQSWTPIKGIIPMLQVGFMKTEGNCSKF